MNNALYIEAESAWTVRHGNNKNSLHSNEKGSTSTASTPAENGCISQPQSSL